jgi:hypothetical protein
MSRTRLVSYPDALAPFGCEYVEGLLRVTVSSRERSYGVVYGTVYDGTFVAALDAPPRLRCADDDVAIVRVRVFSDGRCAVDEYRASSGRWIERLSGV